MKLFNWRILVGVFLVLMGGLTLLQTLNIVPQASSLWPVFISVMFIVVGLGFLVVLFQTRSNWWAAIPGIILMSLGILIGLDLLAPGLASMLGGTLVLGGIGFSFWVVYLLSPKNWWAIIPGGTMMSLAVVAGVDNIKGIESGGFLFLGLAVTFALLAILPTGGKRMQWPWIPAAVLLVMGILISLSSSQMLFYVWPVILILAGLFLVGRTFLKKNDPGSE
jgi:hypothetical protein